MTLILSNDEIEQLFRRKECCKVLEPALRELGNGHAEFSDNRSASNEEAFLNWL